MNNEPVAFWNKDFDLWEENAIQTYKADGWDIPLYTHPADLTDEEIKEIIHRKYWIGTDVEALIIFAHELLRKAQKK